LADHEFRKARNARAAHAASRRRGGRAPGSEQVWKQFSQAQSLEEFCSSWRAIQCQTIGGVSDGVVILLKPGMSNFAPVAFYPDSPNDRSHLAEVSEHALKDGRGVVQPVEDSGKADGRGGDTHIDAGDRLLDWLSGFLRYRHIVTDTLINTANGSGMSRNVVNPRGQQKSRNLLRNTAFWYLLNRAETT
jgi:hypothetical protein